MAPFDGSYTRSYWCSIVTVAPFCIVSEIKQGIDRKLWFFRTHLQSKPQTSMSPSEYRDNILYEKKLEWRVYQKQGHRICLHKIPGGNSRELMHIASLIFFFWNLHSARLQSIATARLTSRISNYSSIERVFSANTFSIFRNQHISFTSLYNIILKL